MEKEASGDRLSTEAMEIPTSAGDANSTEQSHSNLGYISACRSVDLCLMCAAAWVMLCLIVYGRKTRKWKLTSNAKNVDGGKVYITCLVAVVLTFPRFILTQIVYSVPIMSSDFVQCEILIDATVVGYFVAVCPTYFFLWMKQRIIYGHPTISAFIGRCMNVVSIATLPILLLVSLGGLCAFIIPESYISRYGGCYEKPAGNSSTKADKWDAIENFVIGGLNITSQLILLSLFVYPMIKMKKAANRKPDNAVTSIIRRSIISASVAIVSDVLVAALVAQAVPRHHPAVVGITLYDLNIVINVFCMLATFGGATDILLVFCKPRSAIVRRRSSRGSWSSRNEETIKLDTLTVSEKQPCI